MEPLPALLLLPGMPPAPAQVDDPYPLRLHVPVLRDPAPEHWASGAFGVYIMAPLVVLSPQGCSMLLFLPLPSQEDRWLA